MVDWNLGGTGVAGVSGSDTALAQIESAVAMSPRPCVLVSEREISVLRRGLTKDGWKRSLYLQPAEKHYEIYIGAGILSLANRSLDMDTTIPARSGYYHWFFCECGTRLTIPDDLLPKPEYECPACGQVYSGENYDGAVRYLHHQRLASSAVSLALVYGIEKDRTYSDKAAEILLNYARAYPGPHTDHTTGGMMYQSLCEAVWVIPLAQAYDLIYYSRSLSDEDKELIENQLFRPVAEGLKTVGIGGNWGSWHLSAVGVIGITLKDASLVQYALEAFALQMTEQLGDDGLWPESVHTYHFYPLRAFVHLAEACCRVGIDLYNWEAKPGKSLKSMFTAPLQYMYPSFRLPAINDGWYDASLPLDLYELAFRRWNDPAFAWVLKRGYKFSEQPINDDQRQHAKDLTRSSFYAFLFGRDLPGRSGAPALKSHVFDNIGICTLRSEDDVMVTLDYGPFLGHGHLDKLSFTFYAGNELLAADYGTPGYGSKIVDWYRGTASHNTVVVDGKSQRPSSSYGLSAHYCGSFVQFAEATADDHYQGVRQKRRITLVGKWCFLSDEVTSDSVHDYDWIFHCEGKPEPVGDYGSTTLDLSHYPLIELGQAYKARDISRFDCRYSSGTLALELSSHGADAVVAFGACPTETAERKGTACVWRQHGKSARFSALLAASGDGTVDIHRDGCVVRITDGDEVDHIYVRGMGNEASELPLRTDGTLAAVRMRDGEIHSIALVEGSWVHWMGAPLVECPSVVDCVEISFTDRNPLIRYCCDTAGVVKLKTNARAMRINGHRTAAANSDGQALLRVTSQMLGSTGVDFRS